MADGRELTYPNILVTGGGGYVGSALVPRLIERGHRVRVLDLFWYGAGVLDGTKAPERLERVKGDIRDRTEVAGAMQGMDAVIHLACISNDPSFELDAALGKSINYDAFAGLMEEASLAGVQRFIYASSSSVYGVKEKAHVVEEDEPDPLTDYSKFKLLCEKDLEAFEGPGDMEKVIVRPATVCGYAPRLRLDLAVNILTIHALVNKKIRIFGGKQLRPNIHIRDMVRVYEALLDAEGEKVNGQVFNAGYENFSVEDLAKKVQTTLGDPEVTLEYTPSDDNRSYHIDSSRIARVLNFKPTFTIEDAIRDIARARTEGKIPDPFESDSYYNIKRMQTLKVR